MQQQQFTICNPELKDSRTSLLTFSLTVKMGLQAKINSPAAAEHLLRTQACIDRACNSSKLSSAILKMGLQTMIDSSAAAENVMPTSSHLQSCRWGCRPRATACIVRACTSSKLSSALKGGTEGTDGQLYSGRACHVSKCPSVVTL